MSEPILPIPVVTVPALAGSAKTGEGAQTALAAMIRQRKLGGNHIDPDELEPPAEPPAVA